MWRPMPPSAPRWHGPWAWLAPAVPLNSGEIAARSALSGPGSLCRTGRPGGRRSKQVELQQAHRNSPSLHPGGLGPSRKQTSRYAHAAIRSCVMTALRAFSPPFDCRNVAHGTPTGTGRPPSRPSEYSGLPKRNPWPGAVAWQRASIRRTAPRTARSACARSPATATTATSPAHPDGTACATAPRCSPRCPAGCRARRLRHRHRHELVPARHPARRPPRLVRRRQPSELMSRQGSAPA